MILKRLSRLVFSSDSAAFSCLFTRFWNVGEKDYGVFQMMPNKWSPENRRITLGEKIIWDNIGFMDKNLGFFIYVCEKVMKQQHGNKRTEKLYISHLRSIG